MFLVHIKLCMYHSITTETEKKKFGSYLFYNFLSSTLNDQVLKPGPRVINYSVLLFIIYKELKFNRMVF